MTIKIYEAIYKDSPVNEGDFGNMVKGAAAAGLTAGALAAGGAGASKAYSHLVGDEGSPEIGQVESSYEQVRVSLDSGSDHSGKNYSDMVFSNTVIENVDLTGANLSGADFSGCTLIGVNFVGALLREANFDNCEFIEVNILDARSLSRARFYDITIQSIYGGGSDSRITSKRMAIESLLARGAFAHRVTGKVP
jgi:hypothetical protein